MPYSPNTRRCALHALTKIGSRPRTASSDLALLVWRVHFSVESVLRTMTVVRSYTYTPLRFTRTHVSFYRGLLGSRRRKANSGTGIGMLTRQDARQFFLENPGNSIHFGRSCLSSSVRGFWHGADPRNRHSSFSSSKLTIFFSDELGKFPLVEKQILPEAGGTSCHSTNLSWEPRIMAPMLANFLCRGAILKSGSITVILSH